MDGSSPLARGLRSSRIGVCGSCGIIPARAGFTRRKYEPTPPWSDHPRSRGVYNYKTSKHGNKGGSSPLARGLPVDWLSADGAWRIIPARAGFTRGVSAGAWTRADHPRSRGVYGAVLVRDVEGGGSSPLARGLLPDARGRRRRDRIIPARAGFTHQPRGGHRVTADHPRSRGVYAPGTSRKILWAGSSPLARGLHVLPSRWTRRGRIIPARAGFTLASMPSPSVRKDHPRSRGVYRGRRRRVGGRRGSSPLARGLPATRSQ